MLSLLWWRKREGRRDEEEMSSAQPLYYPLPRLTLSALQLGPPQTFGGPPQTFGSPPAHIGPGEWEE